MPVPNTHRSPRADPDLPWDWSDRRKEYTDQIIQTGGWDSMVRAHAWHEDGDGAPERKNAYKLPHHRVIDGRLRVVLEGVRSAMNILAATRFSDDYRVDLPADEVPDVYEHLAAHLRQFGEEPPAILRGWSPSDGWPPPGRR